jgi:hypothetical protein
VCIGCHENFPEKTAALAKLSKMDKTKGEVPITDKKHQELVKSVLRAHPFGTFNPHQRDEKQSGQTPFRKQD